MNGILSILLPLLAKVVPAAVGTTGTAATVINGLVEVVPLLAQEYHDVLPFVKNVIATLKNDPATTQSQLSQLASLDAQVDAAFDAAAAAAEAEDSA